MKYAVVMGSGSMMYISKFHKDCCRHSKVSKREDSQTQTAWRLHKPTCIFQNEGSMLKNTENI
jgi:hypothetical protein